jgi:tetratricopeptide (TPR) repeat protein
MRGFKQCAVAAVAAAALMAATPVRTARADEPTVEDDEKARELFRLAETHYAAGRYEKAAVLYDEAYRLSARAELLLALVNTYERMGEYKQAIARLREYIKHPRARNVATLRDRLRRLEEGEHERDAERDRVRRLEIAEQQRAKEVREQRQPPSQPIQRVEVTTVDRPSRVPAYLLLAGGVLGAGGAVTFGLLSRRASDSADELCTGDGLCQARAQRYLDRESRYAVLSDVSAAVAVASTTVGVILLWRSRDRGDERSALRIGPTPLPGGVGVVLGGEL